MKRYSPAVVIVFCILFATGCSTKNRLEPIQFAIDNSADADSIKTIRSFQKQNEVFTLTHYGSYDIQMEWLNDYLFKEVTKESVLPSKKKPGKRMCSIFFTVSDPGVPYHCQNLDNPESGILIGSFNAPGKYRSMTITRMTDITYFPPSFEFSQLNDIQKSFLPFFAFYPANGINEHGLTVSIAGSYPHKVADTKNRKGVFITYLNRLMLDSCKTVEEALAFANRYYFFDHEGLIATNHLLIGDKLGNAAVIEYDKEGKMQYLLKKKENLVMTNDDIIGLDTSKIKCVRYKAISKQLSEKPVSNYDDCMSILKMVENKTLWSVVMDNRTQTGYIGTRGIFNHLYKFNFDR